MSDPEHTEGHAYDHPDPEAIERTTAPQQPYSMRQVGIGFLVFFVGVALTFGLALGLAGI